MQHFIRPDPAPNAFVQTDERRPRTIELKLRLISSPQSRFRLQGFRRLIASPPRVLREPWRDFDRHRL
jgi:hypothetical protein